MHATGCIPYILKGRLAVSTFAWLTRWDAGKAVHCVEEGRVLNERQSSQMRVACQMIVFIQFFFSSLVGFRHPFYVEYSEGSIEAVNACGIIKPIKMLGRNEGCF